MKCHACNKIFPINSWRTVNIADAVVKPVKTTRATTTPYAVPSVQQYQKIYVCPYCGTLRMRGPLIKESKE